ncbi:hypothetical protein [Actinomadura rudentiformis]|uniref:Uncharacterized protein n=1 Tax=Actinomadura rudentiformis TaxID=359158 RepID=A0A6H9YXL9_9ACTN|nr:hypothetical protein [Actinomadura rudentiformis]KAB2346522.1 hypothetical protein F8566_24030 [Actinomadura rudentiformis]
MEELVLRPGLVTRLLPAGVCLGVFPTVAIPDSVVYGLAGESAVGKAVLGVSVAMVLVCGVLVAWRAFRLATICRPDEVTLRGYLRTIRIPTTSIIAIDVIDADIRWLDSEGTPRRTKVSAFESSSQTSKATREHNKKTMEQIRSWWLATRRESPRRLEGGAEAVEA